MPMVKVELPKYTEFKALKRAKVKQMLERRVYIYQLQRKHKQELEKLNFTLFSELRAVLPEDQKSVDFDGYQVTATLPGAAKRFSKKKLLTTPFECAHCGEDVVVPKELIDECTEDGKTPSPTVSVRPINKDDGTGDDVDEDEEDVE
jgi:hypothetical protein